MSKNIFDCIDVLVPFTAGDKRFHGRDLARKLNLSQRTVQNHLNKLEKMGVLKSEKRGKTKEFRLNKGRLMTEKLLIAAEIRKFYSLVSSDFEVKEIIKDILDRFIGKVLVYGSFAKGRWDEKSDLDVLILGEEKKTEEIQAKYSRNIHFMFLTEKEFKSGLRGEKPYFVEIKNNHIICRGFEEITRLVIKHG